MARSCVFSFAYSLTLLTIRQMSQIDPKRAIPRQEHHRTQKLFVGGLAPTVTTESLRAYFAQFGKVVDATVMVDRDSSRSKGFGFVTFEDIDNVERLLGIGLLEIDGKLVSRGYL